ncbi:hypothetical protein SARC_02195 [Sphaeroforma arctica JP610]|uniref:Uncharacterized protein n=1 Tax=Sphaeroforma arctica JP610 TaxID=667725 RepID=A0A0L0G9D2_9EUKA|nr:hypothetical protein SARC_02195 [Sphaeroforma arctica JP610]KNC85622.1 hypothetical protein SARC_02195 [Sphaeroforma arctica JP610]|eukprot:XP_014159524.1 hypothetical protein SARC_02195 [Sphaeroforma arctica JP610]
MPFSSWEHTEYVSDNLGEELTDAVEQMLSAAIQHHGRNRERILDSLFRWLCRPIKVVARAKEKLFRNPSLLSNVNNMKRLDSEFASSADDLAKLSVNKTMVCFRVE